MRHPKLGFPMQNTTPLAQKSTILRCWLVVGRLMLQIYTFYDIKLMCHNTLACKKTNKYHLGYNCISVLISRRLLVVWQWQEEVIPCSAAGRRQHCTKESSSCPIWSNIAQHWSSSPSPSSSSQIMKSRWWFTALVQFWLLCGRNQPMQFSCFYFILSFFSCFYFSYFQIS